MARRHSGEKFPYVAVAIALMSLALLILFAIYAYQVGLFWHWVIFQAAILLLILGYYRQLGEEPWTRTFWRGQAEKRSWGLLVVVAATLATASGLLPMLEHFIPRPQPRILSKLPGLWGPEGCGVVFRFRIRDSALIITQERRRPGDPPYYAIATITNMDGDMLQTVGEEPLESAGHSSTFTYFTNGVTERLSWNDRLHAIPPLRPCRRG